MIVTASAADSIGARTEQQDQHRRGATARGYYIVVCDGLGGRPDALECARLAADAATEYLRIAHRRRNRKDLVRYLMDLPENVQVELQSRAEAGGLSRDSATTLAIALIIDDQAWLMSIGDSRCTVMRDDAIYETTTPHNLLAETLRDNSPLLTEGQRPAYLAASLTRSIGPRSVGGFDARERSPLLIVPLKAGDVIVVTTDGVHEPLGLHGISGILAALTTDDSPDPAERLVAQAVEIAGIDADNATAVVARVLDGEGGPRGRA